MYFLTEAPILENEPILYVLTEKKRLKVFERKDLLTCINKNWGYLLSLNQYDILNMVTVFSAHAFVYKVKNQRA